MRHYYVNKLHFLSLRIFDLELHVNWQYDKLLRSSLQTHLNTWRISCYIIGHLYYCDTVIHLRLFIINANNILSYNQFLLVTDVTNKTIIHISHCWFLLHFYFIDIFIMHCQSFMHLLALYWWQVNKDLYVEVEFPRQVVNQWENVWKCTVWKKLHDTLHEKHM